MILSESQRPPAPEPARPAPVAQQKPAEEKSKAPLFIGIALVVLILIALVSMLGGDDDASGRALPTETPDALASFEPAEAAAEPVEPLTARRARTL